MEHHKLAQFAMVVFLIFISITVSSMLAFSSIYFYLIGWFTNEKELKKLSTVINNFCRKIRFQELKFTSKGMYKWGLINIGVQFFMGLISVGFTWSIMIIVMFTIPLFLGISSTEENVEKLKQRFYA